MVRPRKIKTINFEPDVTYFKPKSVPLSQIEEVEITLDELETLRLSDMCNMNQSEAANMMEIHQSTFQRTLARVREKVTEALVVGKAIKINGGNYKVPGRNGMGPLGQGARTGKGRGGCAGCGGGYGAGMPLRRNEGNFFVSDMRFGMGRGMGLRRTSQEETLNPITPITKDQEKQMLEKELRLIEAEENEMKAQKELIRKRMEDSGN